MDREGLGSTEHFGPKFDIFQKKTSMLIGVSKQGVCRCLRTRGIRFVPSGPWNYDLRCGVVLYTLCQTTEKTREMLEMIRAEMNSIVPHFKPIKTTKPFKKNNTQGGDKHCEAMYFK